MTIDEARRQFPHTWSDLVYLNHAAISPMSFRVRDAMDRYLTRRSLKGIEPYPWAIKIATETRGLIAEMIGGAGEDIAFVLNTSDGLNIIAEGLDWHPGDHILLNSLEFPSNQYPFLNLKRQGVQVDVIAARDYRVTVDDIRDHLTPDTRLVSISHVQYGTGARADVTAIGALCRERGIWFVVDAIQSLPHVPIDVVADNVDFLASGTHKWLMGPEGTAFVYVSPRAREAIHQANLGWTSVAEPFNHADIDETRLRPDAGRYENGTLNYPGIAGLRASLEFFSEFGLYELSERVLDLADYLIPRLESHGIEVVTPKERSQHAGIISFKYEGLAETRERLEKLGFVISHRGDFLRVSPHFYNTEEELRKFVIALLD
jgi:cysteine desulfurase/selenocysteine lyase